MIQKLKIKKNYYYDSRNTQNTSNEREIDRKAVRQTDGQNRVKNCIQPLENCKSTKITKQQDEDEDQRGG